ncbi:hypothetical protein [Psychrobacillus sp. BM2]|uniref:hypothetical protein n=1 Tax=Psychrobacillus sp. BM2 TaxID=3400421 RepID=UPI003B01D9A4
MQRKKSLIIRGDTYKKIVSQCSKNGGQTGFEEVFLYEQSADDYMFNKPYAIQ